MIRVLIIDDEIIITRYVQFLLQKNFDWEVKIAISVEEAEAEMTQFRPQLVLCDINLGSKIDGIDLIARLQKEFVFDTIYITSYQSEGMIDKAAHTRPVNYIIKPLNEVQFVATMKMAGGRIALPGKKYAFSQRVADQIRIRGAPTHCRQQNDPGNCPKPAPKPADHKESPAQYLPET